MEKAVERLSAEQGHIDSQYNLALCYIKGEGIDQNEKLAAIQGHQDALKKYC